MLGIIAGTGVLGKLKNVKKQSHYLGSSKNIYYLSQTTYHINGKSIRIQDVEVKDHIIVE